MSSAPGHGARPDGARPPWSELRAELERAGFRPSKTLGQNFLFDPNAARSIAADAELAPGTRVLEVGAGCGFLTLALAELALDVLAVEIDARLLAVARRLLAERESVRWLHADVLAGKHALDPRLVAELPRTEPWHVVSNLPYSISAPLLVLLARLPNPPRTMAVLVQDEVARRLGAGPGEPEWGALTARLRLSYATRLGRTVGAQLFWPRPRVASRVAHLRLEAEERLSDADLGEYDAVVEALFQHRRKQLVATLSGVLGGRAAALELLREVGLAPQERAERLGPAELLQLSRSERWRARPEAARGPGPPRGVGAE